MGTNYYWKSMPEDADHMDPIYHLGKRSAAGLYCFDCGITLCKSGEDRIHYGNGGKDEWWDACPLCGGKPVKDEKAIPHSVAVELGFAQPKTDRPQGVDSCSSFTWAQSPAAVFADCRDNKDKQIVQDEYGRSFTGREFLKIIARCPVKYTDSIGQEFS